MVRHLDAQILSVFLPDHQSSGYGSVAEPPIGIAQRSPVCGTALSIARHLGSTVDTGALYGCCDRAGPTGGSTGSFWRNHPGGSRHSSAELARRTTAGTLKM